MSQEYYRARIYAAYTRSRRDLAGRTTLADFAPRRPYLERLVRRHFPLARNAAILELGCGPGALIHFARGLGYTNIAGIDRSPEQIALAAKLGIAGVREGDVLEALANTPERAYDAIIAFDVIEHFTKGEIVVFVDRVLRALKPDGRFIVHTCNAEGPFPGASQYGDFTHEIAFTRASIGQLLTASGFARVECFEDRPIPHGAKSAVRWVLWHFFRAILRLYRAVETGDIDGDVIFSQNFLAVAVK